MKILFISPNNPYNIFRVPPMFKVAGTLSKWMHVNAGAAFPGLNLPILAALLRALHGAGGGEFTLKGMRLFESEETHFSERQAAGSGPAPSRSPAQKFFSLHMKHHDWV